MADDLAREHCRRCGRSTRDDEIDCHGNPLCRLCEDEEEADFFADQDRVDQEAE